MLASWSRSLVVCCYYNTELADNVMLYRRLSKSKCASSIRARYKWKKLLQNYRNSNGAYFFCTSIWCKPRGTTCKYGQENEDNKQAMRLAAVNHNARSLTRKSINRNTVVRARCTTLDEAYMNHRMTLKLDDKFDGRCGRRSWDAGIVIDQVAIGLNGCVRRSNDA